MKQVLIFILLVGSGFMCAAQKVIKEKTETRVSGPIVTKKTKIEYDNHSPSTVIKTNSASHAAYGSVRHRNFHRMGHSRTHASGISRTHKKIYHSSRHITHYREYKRTVKDGKVKIKYKK
jgi:hypothetical protein